HRDRSLSRPCILFANLHLRCPSATPLDTGVDNLSDAAEGHFFQSAMLFLSSNFCNQRENFHPSLSRSSHPSCLRQEPRGGDVWPIGVPGSLCRRLLRSARVLLEECEGNMLCVALQFFGQCFRRQCLEDFPEDGLNGDFHPTHRALDLISDVVPGDLVLHL